MGALLPNLFSFGNNYLKGGRIHLTLFELFVASYSIIYAWSWGQSILRIQDVVLPLGLANYLDISLFFGNYYALVNAAIITICVLIAFIKNHWKWLYFIAFLLLHVQYVTRFSLGEIPHSSNLIGFSLLGLGLGGIFFQKMDKKLFFAFGFTIFFVGLGYTSASISKLVATGVTWVDGNHLWLWIAEKGIDVLSATGSFDYSWVQRIALGNRFAATVILIIGIVTEMIGILIWWRKLRPWVTLLLIGMHVGIYLSMNIFFLSYMIELILIGFPWYIVFDKVPKISYLSGWIDRRFSHSGKIAEAQADLRTEIRS